MMPHKNTLYLLVFITGASIMALEMTFLKLAIQFFGNSIFSWAMIIGFVIAGLAIGYRYGGLLADAFPNTQRLIYLVGIAALLIGITPALHMVVVDVIRSAELFAGSGLIMYSAVFLLPIILLGTASPYITRLITKTPGGVGLSAGSVYCVSTIGSIFGTYTSSLILLPVLGSAATLTVICFVLLLALIPVLVLHKERRETSLLRMASSLAIISILISLAYFSAAKYEEAGLIYRKESYYGLIEVWDWDKRTNSTERAGTLYLDINRSGRWSIFHPDKILTSMYFDAFLPLYYLTAQNKAKTILIVGHAGGVFSRQFLHYFGGDGLTADGIELDPDVSAVARKFFRLDAQKGLTVINDDARSYLQQSKKKYDLIIADAFTGALYIPSNLATREYFSIIQERLSDGGIFAQHLLSHDSNDYMSRCITGTIRSVFPYVYRVDTPIQSAIILASRRDLGGALSSLNDKGMPEELRMLAENMREHFSVQNDGGCIFDDNRAPTELLRELDVIKDAYQQVKKSI
ncbi:fused MFS/spermidine synthase [Candidatus Uhrbacteria bacterium]|nr:fused MFS/spermidine synthase [Candidatus Uhrbacteria bacterium]